METEIIGILQLAAPKAVHEWALVVGAVFIALNEARKAGTWRAAGAVWKFAKRLLLPDIYRKLSHHGKDIAALKGERPPEEEP